MKAMENVRPGRCGHISCMPSFSPKDLCEKDEFLTEDVVANSEVALVLHSRRDVFWLVEFGNWSKSGSIGLGLRSWRVNMSEGVSNWRF